MKNLFNLLIFPALAGIVVFAALHISIPYTGACGPDGLNAPSTQFIFALLGFLFGFMPCFITGYAHHTLTKIRPADSTAIAPEPEIFVGKVITSIGANCQLRVKTVKVSPFAQADFSDHCYALNFSL